MLKVNTILSISLLVALQCSHAQAGSPATATGFQPMRVAQLEDERFSKAIDGAISDRLFGIAWAQEGSQRYMTHSAARAFCTEKGKGWRLPKAYELLSLYHPSHRLGQKCGEFGCSVSSRFRLPTGQFFWTSETGSVSEKLMVNLSLGDVVATKPSQEHAVLCVQQD